MEKEGYYIAVGAFVMLAVGLLIMFIAIISGRGPEKQMQRYEIRFTGSVAGLDVGGEVRYLGVKVGKVAAIRLVPDKPREVSVIIDVDDRVPIYGNTVATLQLQGITGISFVELRKEGPGREPLPAPPPDQLPQIKAANSELEQLARSLPELLDSADAVMDRVSDVLSDQNIARISTLIHQLSRTAEGLPALVARIDDTLREFQFAARDARPHLVEVLARLNAVASELEDISRRTEKLYAHNTAVLNAALGGGSEKLERLLNDSQNLVTEMRRLARRLEANPSLLISTPPARGVEIAP